MFTPKRRSRRRSTSLQNVSNTSSFPRPSLHPRCLSNLSLPTPEPHRPHQTGRLLMTSPHPTWTYDTTHSHALDPHPHPHSFLSPSFWYSSPSPPATTLQHS